MIRIVNVTKKYKNVNVVKNISLELNEGKICGLVGRNGSGKTVLMKCITGFVIPTSGEIYFDNKKLGEDMDFAPDTGVIIETPGFVGYQNAVENLLGLASIQKKIGKSQIIEALELVGLDPENKLKVGKYSLGMRQRLGIAQAIMEKPNTLILDEPMNGLDKDGVEDMRKLFMKLREQGKTILISSHNAEDINILCDSVWEMDKGEVMRIK
ncbi:MAG: ATP-binding cassette domain-containing protein [Lachnospiraceae bacterium]|nr:ATP-binding cassette domain-containing protein [Lachnospiraceae bacterium]